MKTILLITCFFFQGITIGQNIVTPQIFKISKTDLTFGDLQNSSDLFNLRLWNKGQLIDIRILPDSTRTGTIINFVTENSRSLAKRDQINNGKIIPSIYFQKINLSDSEVQKAFQIIEKYKLYELPSSDSVKDWEPVLDGEWFELEQKVNSRYENKYYGNPKSQKKLPEAIRFNNSLSELTISLQLDKRFWNFFGQLEVNCYTRNGEHEIICKKNKLKSR